MWQVRRRGTGEAEMERVDRASVPRSIPYDSLSGSDMIDGYLRMWQGGLYWIDPRVDGGELLPRLLWPWKSHARYMALARLSGGRGIRAFRRETNIILFISATLGPTNIELARWPSGLRRSIKEDILSNQEDLLSSGVGSNPTLVTHFFFAFFLRSLWIIFGLLSVACLLRCCIRICSKCSLGVLYSQTTKKGAVIVLLALFWQSYGRACGLRRQPCVCSRGEDSFCSHALFAATVFVEISRTHLIVTFDMHFDQGTK